MNVRLILAMTVLTFLIGMASTTSLAVEGDVVFKREGGSAGGTPPAVFSHWFHRIRYKCYACHPGIFKIDGKVAKTSMEEIGKGKSCGTCHNGKIAWATSFDNCNKCHVAVK